MEIKEVFTVSDFETIKDSLNDYMMSLQVGFYPQNMETTIFIGEEIDKCKNVMEKIDKLLQDKEL
jgi:hypothetical protein